eukprot:1338642-Ditylum_brightwellii.AAC.1
MLILFLTFPRDTLAVSDESCAAAFVLVAPLPKLQNHVEATSDPVAHVLFLIWVSAMSCSFACVSSALPDPA